MKAYIAGPLITLGNNFLEALCFYERVAEICEEMNIEAFVPHLSGRWSDSGEAIFKRDYEALKQADIIIADVGKPSIGVGAEIGLMRSMDKFILGYYGVWDDLSSFIAGLLLTYDKALIVQYGDSKVSGVTAEYCEKEEVTTAEEMIRGTLKSWDKLNAKVHNV